MKISIIVPIYKVEKYLEKCINSIINQSYRDIEVILVDDGSPDSCPAICDEYAKNDSRIKVIHKQNGGVSSARNAGIKVASGEYITFVDGDDYIEDLTQSVSMVKNEDIICFPYYEIYRQKKTLKTPNKKCLDKYNCNLNGAKVFGGMWNPVWQKFFKTDLIKQNNISFDENYKIAEDLKFCLDCFRLADNISFVGKPYYVYNRNDESVMANVTYKKICNTLEVCEYSIKLNEEIKDKKLHKFVKKLISENLISVLVRANNYEKEENMHLKNSLCALKGNFVYGSTFAKKCMIFAVKVFGIKLVIKILKILKRK